jgi:uncharacterized protein (DUF433 family)
MRWSEITERMMTEDRSYDWSKCPLVESVPEKLSGAPVIVGTRMPVQAIVDNYDLGMEPNEIAEQWNLNIVDVNAILQYREKLNARSV